MNDTLLSVVLIGWLVVLPLVFSTISALKAKYVFALLGIVFGLLHLIGALRVAKPHSWWARRYYSRSEMNEAIRRFPRSATKLPADWQPRHADPDEEPALPYDELDEWTDEELAHADRITRRAVEKRRRQREWESGR